MRLIQAGVPEPLRLPKILSRMQSGSSTPLSCGWPYCYSLLIVVCLGRRPEYRVSRIGPNFSHWSVRLIGITHFCEIRFGDSRFRSFL
jgi:hypothetical protein